jgi:DNA repair exonuclease SbcCD ATPase subunit
LARNYGRQLKDEITAFAGEKAAAVRDYGVELEVKKSAAKEVLNRLNVSSEELAEKADAVKRIGDRISAYDKSLEELVRMTGRVEENFSRLRNEAAFVEQVDKKLGETRDRFSALEKAMDVLRFRFEKENAAAIEQTDKKLDGVKTRIDNIEKNAGLLGARFERENAALIEQAGKNLDGLKDRLADFEKAIVAFKLRFDQENAAASVKAGEAFNELRLRFADAKKELGEFVRHLEKENEAALEKTSESLAASVCSTAAGFRAEAEILERRIEDHREALDRAEKERGVRLEQELELINKTLKEALEKAAARSGRLEESALVKLREEAMERVKRFQEAVEEKLGEFREQAKTQAAEVQEIIKSCREEQRAFQADWKRDAEALDALALTQRAQWDAAAGETEARLLRLGKELAESAEDAERRVLEEAEARLAGYREAQAGQWERLDSMADEADKLDGQLRVAMSDAEERVRGDFAKFEEEQREAREKQARFFDEEAGLLRAGLLGLEQELKALKDKASENVTEKYRIFEAEFLDGLEKRGRDIDRRLDQWRAEMEQKFEEAAAGAGAERGRLEAAFFEELKSGLDRLKSEAETFKEGIHAGMAETDGSLAGFRERVKADLEDARSQAESGARTELDRYALEMNEKIAQNERELEDWRNRFNDRLREAENEIEDSRRNARDLLAETEDRAVQMRGELENVRDKARTELDGFREKARTDLDDLREKAKTGLNELRENARTELDELRKTTRNGLDEVWEKASVEIERAREETASGKTEILARTGAQVKALEETVREAEKRIKDFAAQTKLFERADELKLELERRIEDLKGSLEGLDQRRAEAAGIEAQYAAVRRLGDEVNAKMSRFLSEKNRLDVMENDFNRLVATSRAVEEKLRAVSTSDDILQGMQVQLRRLEDAMKNAEEKFERLERKNQVLEETSAGVDRNFRLLEETEEALKRLDGELERSSDELEAIKPSVRELAAAGEKAKEANEKLGRLDESLADIEKRIEEMQVAREWIARTETRLEEINKQAQEHVRLLGAMVKDGGKAKSRGAPNISARENAVNLARQGWKVDEIATALKISRAEVELILEMGVKD